MGIGPEVWVPALIAAAGGAATAALTPKPSMPKPPNPLEPPKPPDDPADPARTPESILTLRDRAAREGLSQLRVPAAGGTSLSGEKKSSLFLNIPR